jgi:hypothetical protein
MLAMFFGFAGTPLLRSTTHFGGGGTMLPDVVQVDVSSVKGETANSNEYITDRREWQSFHCRPEKCTLRSPWRGRPPRGYSQPPQPPFTSSTRQKSDIGQVRLERHYFDLTRTSVLASILKQSSHAMR